MFFSNTDLNSQEHAPRNDKWLWFAGSWIFLNCDTTPQILSSETLKNIQELLNNGFVNRMKSLRMQQMLCQTVLKAGKKVQILLMDESKEYFIKY